MLFKIKSSIIILGAMFIINAPAIAQTWTSATASEMQARIEQLEAETRALRAVSGFSNGTNASSDTLLRLDAIEIELSRLTGLTEQLQYEQRQVIDSQGRKIDDLEFRLSELERRNGFAGNGTIVSGSGVSIPPANNNAIAIPSDYGSQGNVDVQVNQQVNRQAVVIPTPAPTNVQPQVTQDYNQGTVYQSNTDVIVQQETDPNVYGIVEQSQSQSGQSTIYQDDSVYQDNSVYQDDSLYQTNGGFQTLDEYGAGQVIYDENGQARGAPAGTLGTIQSNGIGDTGINQASDGTYTGIYQSNDVTYQNSDTSNVQVYSQGTVQQNQVVTTQNNNQVALATPSVSAGGDPRGSYDAAMDLLRTGDFASAQIGFQTFLNNNPNHDLAGNAQYWLGETYYVRASYDVAAQAFLNGFKQYPNSRKAPDSLLKLGMTLRRLQQKDEACLTFSELGKRYPNATPSVLGRAAAEAADAGCS